MKSLTKKEIKNYNGLTYNGKPVILPEIPTTVDNIAVYNVEKK